MKLLSETQAGRAGRKHGFLSKCDTGGCGWGCLGWGCVEKRKKKGGKGGDGQKEIKKPVAQEESDRAMLRGSSLKGQSKGTARRLQPALRASPMWNGWRRGWSFAKVTFLEERR